MKIPTDITAPWPPCIVCGQPARLEDYGDPDTALCAACDADIAQAAASYYPDGATVPGWRYGQELMRRLGCR